MDQSLKVTVRLCQLLIYVSGLTRQFLMVFYLCLCVGVGGLDQILGFIGYLWMSVCVLFKLCMCVVVVCAVGGFGSDIELCWLLVAVNLCYDSVVYVRALVWIRYQALLATCSCQSVFCFSCACVCVGLDQISGFVGYL